MKFLSVIALTSIVAVGGVARAETTPPAYVGPGLVAAPALSSPAAGDAHTCVVRNETVWCTGANVAGQLGTGTFARTTAFAESQFTQAIAVSAGANTTCGIRSDGTLWCWGTLISGIDASGFVTRINSPTPVQVPIFNVQSVSISSSHICALVKDASMWCWGANNFGQLGNGTTIDSAIPVRVVGESFSSLDVGPNYSCAIGFKNRVWCWGSNAYHRLGQRASRSQLTPVRVGSLQATIVTTGETFACVVNMMKKVQCWGRNNYGQLGIKPGSSRIAATTQSVKNVVSLSAGSEYVCATTEVATSWCWGRNRFGQLANGSNVAKPKPQKVLASALIGSLSNIATGASHACALSNFTSAMWCWGLGSSGQLGDSASSNRTQGTIVWQNNVQLNSIGSDTAARLVVTGDISCDNARRVTNGVGTDGAQCGTEATARLATTLNPDAVLALGDLQYEGASSEDFKNFYDPTWGVLKNKTYPVRGNHEYVTNGAAGYVDYFGPISPSYWTTNAGGWRIIAVDSWCQGLLYAGCSATSPQTTWLSTQLKKAHDELRCALVVMHHPFVSSGPYATVSAQYLWKAAVQGGADLVMTGHDHHYERFSPLNELGEPTITGGTPLIIAGLGGAPTYALRETAPGSQTTDNRTHGVVSLTLTPTGFSSEFVSAADGVASDTFSSPCTP